MLSLLRRNPQFRRLWLAHVVSRSGDAFNAGFVAGHLKGLDLEECGKLGGALGAAALGGTGDYETIPHWAEAKQLAAAVHVHELEETR